MPAPNSRRRWQPADLNGGPWRLVDEFTEVESGGVSSMRGIARALAARGVKTTRGGDWSDVQVAAVLRR